MGFVFLFLWFFVAFSATRPSSGLQSARPVDQVLPLIEVSVPESGGLVVPRLTTIQLRFQGKWADLRGQPQGERPDKCWGVVEDQ